MNNIATLFSIKDLENLSGIKAHTIRIWEKRYDMLQPSRTDSNIRLYDLTNFQKLLNVALLYEHGVKISKIALMSDQELQLKVRSHIATGGDHSNHLSALKIAMLNFDRILFDSTYNRMTSELSFRDIFIEVFIPLLNNIGLEWQSNSITPAHEHFISNLVRQKLHINIERVQQTEVHQEQAYVLFLPESEIHEFGLLFIHYELLLRGHKSIYLGQSVPLDNLAIFPSMYEKIKFVSYFTVQPVLTEVAEYVQRFHQTVLGSSHHLTILGRNADSNTIKALKGQGAYFSSISAMLNTL